MTPTCGHHGPAGVCGAPPVDRYLTGPRCAAHTPAAVAGRPEPGATRGHTPHTYPTAPRHYPDADALECVHCRRPVAPVNVAIYGAAEHTACVPPPASVVEAWARHEAAKRQGVAA